VVTLTADARPFKVRCIGVGMRQRLRELAKVLKQNDELRLAYMTTDALGGSEDDLHTFLISDELWGCSGSIADLAGRNQDHSVRRAIEQAMIQLGEEQVRANVTNARTEKWVDAFRKWQEQSI
jgi:hypothetical protein